MVLFQSSNVMLNVNHKPGQVTNGHHTVEMKDAKEDDIALLLHTSGTNRSTEGCKPHKIASNRDSADDKIKAPLAHKISTL